MTDNPQRLYNEAAHYAAAIGTVIGFVLASLFWAGRGHD